MPTKLQFYSDLADTQARQITGSRESWTGFLTTAGRLYKYPFEEQLMIFAQRPDATACAPIETWNKPMNRFVRRGSKGIALIDNTGDRPRLRYVFDFADTYAQEVKRDSSFGYARTDGRVNARKPFVWEYKPEHKTAVMEALDKTYGIADSMGYDTDNGRALLGNDLGDYIYGLAQSLSARYYEDNSRDIGYASEGSFLEDYDEHGISVAFREALTVSAAYCTMTRLGIDPTDYFEDEDFQPIFDFNTPAAVGALGKAVSNISEEVLREIEITIKKYERSKTAERGAEHEQSNLYTQRRLSDTRPNNFGAGAWTNQIRHDAEILSQGTPPDTLQSTGTDREAVSPLPGDRGFGDREVGTDDVADDTAVTTAEQSHRPDGLDGTHERLESTGGGNDNERVDLQLNNDLSGHESEAPSDEGGVSTSTKQITADEINAYLTKGSVTSDSKYRIFSFFLHNHDAKEKIAFLKDEYGYGGGTYDFASGERGHADAIPSSGITLAKGGYGNPDAEVTLKWTNVASRIDRLIRDGAYMSQAELDRIQSYERQMLGAGIQNFYSNLPEDIARPVPMADGLYGDYWGNARKIGDMLDSPETVRDILTAMRPVMENTPTADRYYDIRKAAFDNLTAFEKGTFTLFPNLQDTTEPTVTPSPQLSFTDIPVTATEQISLFPTEQEQRDVIVQAEQAAFEREAAFSITGVDIDTAIRAWNGDIESKIRVYEYMHEHARARDTAAFLKSEYGGDLPVFTVTKGEFEQSMPWAKVQWRIAQLMDEGQFLTADEQALADVRLNETWDTLAAENTAQAMPEPETTAQATPTVFTSLDCPPPVFFVDWKEAQHDFDLSLYRDGDIIGYDESGVEYALGRSGNLTYITNTTMITPWGDILGDSDIPLNIREQMVAFRKGDLSEAQARETYLQVLSDFKAQKEAAVVTQAEPTEATIPETSLPQVDLSYTARFNLAKEAYPDHIVMTQLGDFYEFYGEDAQYVASELGFTLTGRNVDGGERMPLVGIPLHNTEIVVSQINEHYRDVVLIDTAGNMTVSAANEGSAFEREMLVDEIPQTQAQPQTQQEQQITPTHIPVNFRITDDHLGEGGAKNKFNTNVKAIRTLKQIEAENRLATPDEQAILSRYVGWGGLPQAFDSDNLDWCKEYTTLQGLLNPTEYDMARASTLNAHYTSPTVIKAIYDTVERLGFTSGNILEPACGVGNFFGLLPESMQSSKLYGVELDSITGRIAKQLYQKADITISGFEKTTTPDSFFDVAIGNVPFGSYGVADKRYDKQNFLIHDYFFAKALDQVRPGGIVAFITSKGTLDKQNPEVRKYLAQRAELLGAVRLPNTAFKANAGTEVTSDIIFLQKRDRLIDIQPDWVNTWHNADGIAINRYFIDNPHMILGTMTTETTQYGHDTTCKPIEGADLGKQLRTALSSIDGQITEVELDDIEGIQDISIPADPTVRNFSYTLVDGTVYFRENSRMNPVDMPTTTLERVKGMVELRDCVQELIDYQLHDYGDADILAKQGELTRLYDSFSRKYGLINDSANNKALSADSSYYLLCSLEVLNENNELERKSDMFTKRTIKQKTVITSVDTSAEALAVSIAKKARVDMDYMQELTGFSPKKIAADLQGVIFRVPHYDHYVSADEYLSGNVREKLRIAQAMTESDPTFSVNVKALTQAQPKDLDASEISVRLGSTWVDKEYIKQFMFELLQPSRYMQYELAVNYSEHTGEWNIPGKTKVSYNDVLATVTYGTSRASAYKILEETLNLKDVRIYDIKEIDGKEQRVLNKKETTLAQQKQEALKQAFKDWIFRDPERRQALVKQYNEQFNSIRPREYDGSHIEFTGISPEIELKPHQRDAIARILYGGNTLLAHEVGAGKTFEMVGAAMESKRLGLCSKSLMAVPNHLTEQMASEFLRLYPSANILVATKKDFEAKNRKKFCAKIATGDYDAVIIGHSQLEKIPLSKERQERLLNEQIWEITDGIDELKRNNGERFTIKQLEKTKKSLETRLQKLTDGSRKDDVVTFEQLGVDRLYVDESHAFKNLFLYTKMRNVAGLSTSEAQKSSDMFMKCRYMDEITGGKGVIFATGTPVTNSIAELYTVQRYLQYDTLREKGLVHFDAWASTFGETQTSIELSPEGSGYRARTRFAKFTNLPELMNLFKEVADIKTADTLDLPRPKANFHTVVAQPSDIQQDMVRDLSDRAKLVHDKMVDPSTDNMLCITSDGRKIGLDQRLMNPLLPDDEGSKVNACMENIHRIWEETADRRLAQVVFCDFSTPNSDGRFNVYDDIKAKLLAKGIPESEIAFIHDYNTEAQKKELFAKVRKGQVRVLFGSTFKCGAGTNIQDRLVALHDLDCPWRPSDLTQRSGRIVRQGNQNPEVDIFRYTTSGTFDSYLFQTVQKKQEFISQIMTSKSPVRSCDDVDDEALSYAEIKALCAGNPLIKEKMELDIEVAKLRLLKGDHQSQQYRLQDELLQGFPKRIEAAKSNIEGFKADMARLESNTHKTEESISPMTIGDKTYTDRGQAGAALLEVCKSIKSTEPTKIGSYRGFDMLISFDSFNKEFNLAMKGAMTHATALGDDSFGNITRINNAFEKIPQRLMSVEAQLQTLYDQTENAKAELTKPFPFEQALAEKSARLAELDAQLNMDERSDEEAEHDTEAIAAKAEPMPVRAEAVSAKEKPSILESIKVYKEVSREQFGGKQTPEKNDRKADITI